MINGMKCTQYYKNHNTEHKRYSLKTLNKYNAYINDMHFYSRRHTILHVRIPGTVEIH